MSRSPARAIDEDGAIGLLAAVVLQALKEAARGDVPAIDWLHGGECDEWLTACGLEMGAHAFTAPRLSKTSARV